MGDNSQSVDQDFLSNMEDNSPLVGQDYSV